MAERPRWLERLLGDEAPSNPQGLADIEALRKLANGDPRASVPSDDRIASWTVDVVVREAQPRLLAEVVVPAGSGPHPVVLWLHGGAWCVGNAAAARKVVAQVAAAGFLVVNLDYALAPEHPFPQAIVDVLAAWDWIGRHGGELGADLDRVALAGTSAGANLALAATVARVGDDGGRFPVPPGLPDVGALVLLYGVFDFALLNGDTRSNAGYVEHLYNAAYLGPHFLSLQSDPLVSPARSTHLGACPSTLVLVGADDHLLPQSLAVIDSLARSGVDVRGVVAAGLDHSFDLFDDAPAEREIADALAWLGEALAR
jgi:acetyl esterase